MVLAPAVLRAPPTIPDPAQPTKYSNSSPSPRKWARSRRLSYLGRIASKLFAYFLLAWRGEGGGGLNIDIGPVYLIMWPSFSKWHHLFKEQAKTVSGVEGFWWSWCYIDSHPDQPLSDASVAFYPVMVYVEVREFYLLGVVFPNREMKYLNFYLTKKIYLVWTGLCD